VRERQDVRPRILRDVPARNLAFRLSPDVSQPGNVNTEDLTDKNVTAVIVTVAGKPTGIFTERDVLKRVAARELNPRETSLKEVMTMPIIMMPGSTFVGDVLAEMYHRDIRNMPVKDDQGELTGLVSMPEILQFARAFNIDEQVRRSWKEVAEYLDNEDQYTPG